ncbi:MAG: hypothetical protein UX07_C0013G0005 [Parcubacteria group bacterium GW2011_GWA2_45_30]|nr:MAG: hypothetical protein UX07_C0013G0005 [Parcubacteria group bacterium GW2011_GWA2_45_30]
MGKPKKEITAFLDASVLVAAALSPSGGSFRILNESLLHGFGFVTSPHAFGESERVLIRKYPDRVVELHHLAVFLNMVLDTSEKFAAQFTEIINVKDVPILAAAVEAGVDVLITLDREHFLNNQLLKDKLPALEILTPGDFIQKYFL